MSQPASDDKIQMVVSLVLQAVDQRLGSVREQLVQLNNHIGRSHAQLQAQINEYRALCEGGNHNPTSAQLLEMATLLAERASAFEHRMTNYVDSRLAEIAPLQPARSAPLAMVPPLRVVPESPADAGVGSDVDVEALTAHVNERLAAAIERALGG